MALISTEQKSKLHINWFALVMTTIFVGFALISTYLLFFQQPPLVETLAPINKGQERLGKIVIAPEKIIDSEKFKSLRQTTIFLEPLQVGRSNPFLQYSAATPTQSQPSQPGSETQPPAPAGPGQ